MSKEDLIKVEVTVKETVTYQKDVDMTIKQYNEFNKKLFQYDDRTQNEIAEKYIDKENDYTESYIDDIELFHDADEVNKNE